MAQSDEQPVDGVQRLIDRIREDAVGAGRAEAEKIVERAKAEATEILAAAQRERDEMKRRAHHDIEVESQAARAAVHTAARDVVLSLKAGVIATFEAHVKRLVSDALRDPELMRTLVLVIAGRVHREATVDKDIEVVVSALIDEHPADEPMPSSVRDGILGISHGMLREGVELRASPKVAAGAKVRIVGEAVEVDLTEDAISEMLLAYLTPRFRWIIEGTQ
jgi:V/A-type H+-transporting ATPase subunit E